MRDYQLISYAIREDPYSIFLLTDGGELFPHIHQIAVFKRKLIYPDYVDEFMYLDSFINKFTGEPTKLQKAINEKRKIKTDDYVIKIESQVEFSVKDVVINKLQEEFFPSWSAGSYFKFFKEQDSGVIVFFKVYKVSQNIDKHLLEKGHRGGQHIIRLYDEHETETSVSIKGLTPVLSDNKFEYIKDQILHILKSAGAVLGRYDSSEQGKTLLKNRIEAERLLNHPVRSHEIYYDPDSPVDMAQLDYDNIFREVLQIAPQMDVLVNHIKRILPAQKREADTLFDKIWSNSSDIEPAKERIIEMHLRMALKEALYYYKKFGIDIEDAFQEAVIGIIIAVSKYNKNINNLFAPYASRWMRQVMQRELPIAEASFRLPDHVKQKLIQVMAYIHQLQSIYNPVEKKTIIGAMVQKYSFTEDEAKRIFYIVNEPISTENLNDLDEMAASIFNDNTVIDKADEHVEEINRKTVIHHCIKQLKPREQKVIILRYGIKDGIPRTLEEVGGLMGLTRERIRQIEQKGLFEFRSLLLRFKTIGWLYSESPITETGMSEQLVTCLLNHGIKTVNDLNYLTLDILKSFPESNVKICEEAKRFYKYYFCCKMRKQ